jgi:DNA-binding MarR family transcriptional regulator
MPRTSVSTRDLRALASFRHEIRKFLAFSEGAARREGLEPQQHQLLLAVSGLPPDLRPTIGVIAQRLCVQPHTAVSLVDKLEAAGLVERARDEDDRRQVLLRVTSAGDRVLGGLSRQHRQQLRSVGPDLVRALQELLPPSAGDSAAARVSARS